MVPLVAILSDAGHFQLAGSLLATVVDRFFGEGKRPRSTWRVGHICSKPTRRR